MPLFEEGLAPPHYYHQPYTKRTHSKKEADHRHAQPLTHAHAPITVFVLIITTTTTQQPPQPPPPRPPAPSEPGAQASTRTTSSPTGLNALRPRAASS